MADKRSVRIVEVGPRDGLQNEAIILPLEQKIELVERLIAAGMKTIEVTSFVNPMVIPQLADADDLIARLPQRQDVNFIALVPNERGYDRATDSGLKRVEVFTAATDEFSLANINCTVDQSFDRFRPIFDRAGIDGVSVRGAVSVAFHCPFTGPVAPEQAIRVAERLFDAGCEEVAICDTIGHASRDEVERLLDASVGRLPFDHLALHVHDTYGQAITNVEAGWEAGLGTFDASVGGLGGCPFAPGAPGNVATESVAALFAANGIDTGVKMDDLISTAAWVKKLLAESDVGR